MVLMPGTPRRSSSYSFSTPLFPMLLLGWYGLAMPLELVLDALLGVDLVLVDASDVAEHVGGEDAVVVARAPTGARPHRGVLVGPLGEVEVEVVGDVDGDRDRLQRVVLLVGQALLDGGDLGGDARTR